jgi:Fis family transcriptional regulator, factor for inversion stimulation protein
VKEQLEALIAAMVDRGILLDEAAEEFEKKFIACVLDRTQGNQCKAARKLGIHRNTLSRKVGEYKLDGVPRRRHRR